MTRKETKRKLKEIPTKEQFESFVDRFVLSDREKVFMKMFYVEKKRMVEIADTLFLSEQSVLKMHASILDKIGSEM